MGDDIGSFLYVLKCTSLLPVKKLSLLEICGLHIKTVHIRLNFNSNLQFPLYSPYCYLLRKWKF